MKQKNNIKYFSDRSFINSIPHEIVEALRSHGLVAPDMFKIYFCGVISYDDNIAVFLPRNHGINEGKEAESGYYLLQALHKYFQTKESGLNDQENGDHFIGGRAFSLIVNLFNDYQLNGLYARRVKEHTINSGKVNWPRTIARNTPYPSNGKPIYLDLMTSRSRYITNCETAKIHAQVIRELLSHYGFLLLGKQNIIDEELERLEKPLGEKKQQIKYLERELRLSYSERDIFLIKGLIQYIKDRKGQTSSDILIGVRKFHSVWEAMLDECLVGKYVVNHKLPIPYYQTNNNEFVAVSKKGQRTDTVIQKGNEKRFAVIDAKYYDAKSPQTAPGWPDIVKQLFYQQAVSILEGEDTKISNHFVFPGDLAELKSAHIGKRNKKIEDINDCLSQYEPIYCHYQPPMELIRAYVRNTKLERLSSEIFLNVE